MAENIRIAFVVGTIEGRGGMETTLSHWVRALRQRGMSAQIMLLDPPKHDGWLADLPHIVLSDRMPTGLLQKAWRIPQYWFRLRKALQQMQPTLIVGANPFAVRLAALCRSRNAVLASWIHFPFKDYPRIHWLRRADVHFAISHGLKAQLERRFPHQPTVWLPNFIEVEAMNPVATSSDWQLVFIGRLAMQIRVDIVLTAIRHTKHPWSLQIIGDGPERPALEAYASELGLSDRVRWLGWRADPWTEVKASLLVLPSDFEGMPLIILEAMARGLPVVATDCEFGPADIVQDGKNGWLFPVGGQEDLTRILDDISDGVKPLPEPQTVVNSVKQFDAEVVIQRLVSSLGLVG